MENTDSTAFLKDKPTLSRILEKYGHMSVLDYISSIYQIHTKDLSVTKKQELHSVLDRLSQRILKKPYPLETSDLLNTSITSTADHHGVLTHPFFLGANYARGLYIQTKTPYTTITTLPCAGISLSNNSYPRGYIYTDIVGQQHSLPFISLKNKNIPVYTAPLITKFSIQKTIDSMYLASIHTEDKKLIISFLKELRDDSHLYTLVDFDEQASYINYLFFKHLDGCGDLDLVYFPQESVVRELLLDYHVHTDTIISKLLFNTKYHSRFKKHFDTLVGAFDTTNHTGTELFWGISEKSRVSLSIVDGFLVSVDQSISIALSPKEIAQALQEKKIMPSMALTFIVLSFYYGVICGGGYSQVDYLEKLALAWQNLCPVDTNIENILPSTDIYFGDIVFLKSKHKNLINGLDILNRKNIAVSDCIISEDFNNFMILINKSLNQK